MDKIIQNQSLKYVSKIVYSEQKIFQNKLYPSIFVSKKLTTRLPENTISYNSSKI